MNWVKLVSGGIRVGSSVGRTGVWFIQWGVCVLDWLWWGFGTKWQLCTMRGCLGVARGVQGQCSYRGKGEGGESFSVGGVGWMVRAVGGVVVGGGI